MFFLGGYIYRLINYRAIVVMGYFRLDFFVELFSGLQRISCRKWGGVLMGGVRGAGRGCEIRKDGNQRNEEIGEDEMKGFGRWR